MDLYKGSIKHKTLILVGLILIAAFIGYLSSIQINNGPFLNFYNNNLMDFIYIPLIIILLYWAVYMVSVNHGSKLLYILTIALTIRISVVFAMSFFGFLPYQFDSEWDIHAFNLLQDWNSGNFHFNIDASSNVKYYSIITTVVYFLFNPNPIYMQFFNVFLSILSVYLVYRIAIFLWNKNVALLSASIIALWPTVILFSSMQMRESISIVLILSLIYFFLKWITYKKTFNLLMAFLFLIGSMLIRSQNGVLFTLLLSPFIVIIFWKNAPKYMKPLMIIGSFVVIAVMAVFLISTGYSQLLDFNYIATEMSYRTGGGSSYLGWMNYSSIIDIIIYSPLRLFYFLFTPLPWQIKDVTELLAFFESLSLFFMTFYIFKNFKYLWKENTHKIELVFLIFFCILGLAANGIIDSNVGTAIRHKTQFVYLFFFLFAAVYHHKKSNFLYQYSK